MCAILDANVAGQVFGAARPTAGDAFFRWIHEGCGRLVVGGRLLQELDRNGAFKDWRRQAVLAGRITLLNDDTVDGRATELGRENACRSNDKHVIAVAQLGGARLLYSNDGDLQKDFRDKALIDRPRGRVYSTRIRDNLTRTHRRLLANRNLCTRGDDDGRHARAAPRAPGLEARSGRSLATRSPDGKGPMLKKLTVRNFKSLVDVSVEFPRLVVLFGPNAAGKSNLLDAIAALSWIGNVRTLSDVLDRPLPVRGHAFEAFSYPVGGLPALLKQQTAGFSLEADLAVDAELYRYRVEPSMELRSGRLSVADEYLALLGRNRNPKGTPAIERVESNLRVRRKGKPAHPRQEPLGMNHAILSDRSLAGDEYRWLEAVRGELGEWCTHYLDPGLAMRAPRAPADVFDVGVHGEYIGPFLYKLRAEEPKRFEAVSRTLRSIVPSVESLAVYLDERRGTLDILIRQGGVEYSTRIVSEGTLRVLALCAIAVNPWGGSLLAFEEPENGVHPRRLDLIPRLLLSLASDGGRQVIVTTHSPLFCDAVLKHASAMRGEVGLFNVRRVGQATTIEPFDPTGPLFKDTEIAAALTNSAEDGLFENLLLRGLIDE